MEGERVSDGKVDSVILVVGPGGDLERGFRRDLELGGGDGHWDGRTGVARRWPVPDGLTFTYDVTAVVSPARR
jgi:hypothetical protein